MKKAVFPGSFDPFTIGHYDIVCRGLQIFDEIIIGIGSNIDKKSMLTLDDRVERIKKAFANEPRVKVVTYNELTTDFADRNGVDYILRGVRSVADYEYERNLADINRALSGIETIVLFAKPENGMISSSMLRDMMRYGKDISKFIPQN